MVLGRGLAGLFHLFIFALALMRITSYACHIISVNILSLARDINSINIHKYEGSLIWVSKSEEKHHIIFTESTHAMYNATQL